MTTELTRLIPRSDCSALTSGAMHQVSTSSAIDFVSESTRSVASSTTLSELPYRDQTSGTLRRELEIAL